MACAPLPALIKLRCSRLIDLNIQSPRPGIIKQVAVVHAYFQRPGLTGSECDISSALYDLRADSHNHRELSQSRERERSNCRRTPTVGVEYASVESTAEIYLHIRICASYFRPGGHLYRVAGYQEVMKSRFAAWRELSCVPVARLKKTIRWPTY